MTPDPAAPRLARLVHRYCGRELGGHVLVGQVQPLEPELERLLQRRSDLSGEDLGRPVPSYLSGYPLPDGRWALALTRYLADADCLGAVRTETLLLDAAAQARLRGDPLAARAAFEPDPDLARELAEYRARRAPGALEPAACPAPGAAALAARLAPLLALPPAARAALLQGLCGPLPLAVVGGEEPLLDALLALFPPGGAFRLGFSSCALSPREWAGLWLVPPAARDRFALRAARERDLALLELERPETARNLGPSPAATALDGLLEHAAWDELEALLLRAAGRDQLHPRDLDALLREEALLGLPRRAPEEHIELANLLRARGAPPGEQAAPFRALLRDPPPGRAPWLLNVLRAGWLPYRRAHAGDAAEAAEVERALLAALEAGRADLVRAFLEDGGALYPGVETRVARAALRGLLEGPPSGGAGAGEAGAGEARALLALPAARQDPAAAVELARALLRHDAGEQVLLQLGPLLERAEPRARDAARVALLGAAVQQGRATAAAAALQALDPAGTGDDALASGWALAAASPLVEPVLLARAAGTLDPARRLPLDGLLRGARARPEALRAVGGALLRRDDLAAPGALRPLGRLEAVARRAGEPGLARAARARLLELRRTEQGPAALSRQAARRARAGAFGRAAEVLAVALSRPLPAGPAPASAEGRRPTGTLASASAAALDAVVPRAQGDDDEEAVRTGALGPQPDEATRTGALGPQPDEATRTGALGPGALADELPGPDDPGPDDPALRAALGELLPAVAAAPVSPATAPAARALLELLPDPAWEVELALLARLLPLLSGPAHEARLRAAAARALAADPAGAAALAGAEPRLVSALCAALLAPVEGDPGAWLRAATALAAGPGAALLPRPALAEATARRLRALQDPGDPLLLDQVLGLARALGQPTAWSALLELALAARTPPPALLRPALRALPALTPALAARLAARVGEGALPVEELGGLPPPVLDAVLGALPAGFSLRLQNGLKAVALALAEGPDLVALEALSVVLRHLQPRVAPDRAFRQELAQGLQQRLGGRAAGELQRALAALAR